MSPKPEAQAEQTKLFLPSARAAAVIAALGLAALGAALWLRYALIQNTETAIACETEADALICQLRLAAIALFVRGLFGWTALVLAGFQLWRPNVVVFAAGVVCALLGLVLYNTRIAALAVPLLLLSLARSSPEGR